jgi:hypothetical protein
MRLLKSAALVAGLMVVASGATWIYAQQIKGPKSMLPAADHLEIIQLYGYYARDVDGGSVRGANWMYTDDGVWDMQGRIIKDAEMKTFYEGLLTSQASGVRHFATNPVIVPTPEGARGSIYMMQVSRKEKGGPIILDLFGKYEDWLVKTPKGWRFARREWRADTYRGDLTPITPSPYAAVE